MYIYLWIKLNGFGFCKYFLIKGLEKGYFEKDLMGFVI